ncbi:MAG: transporter [Gemmatimonadota bacterium]|nr:transporter [Gemmatimonadota bacterium]
MQRHLLVLIAGALGAHSLTAQTDYRNLDDDRPAAVEDAYPLERGAFELLLPYHFSREAGRSLHASTPELAWGALPNLAIGVKAPLGAADAPGTSTGLAGIRLFSLYNFFTEAPSLPALALRGDLHLPVGALGGEDARVSLKLLATRSFGPWRVHLNGGYGFGDPAVAGAVEPLPRWSAGAALDRTLYRQSLLLVGDVIGRAADRNAPTEVEAGLGLRWQWTPTLVLDAGLRRRLSEEGHDIAFGLGLTHAFAIQPGRPRSIVESPNRPIAQPPALESRDATFYFPGRFNWQFLKRHPDAARLFNAFDYGHAVLYERLLTSQGAAGDALERREFDFLVNDLLRRPPRLGVAEESVAPAYARLAWRAKLMFEWAHILHRQIYDLYADERLSDSARVAMVERVTDHYLANTRLAFTTAPKSMALMDEAYYSQVFRQRYPKFNGLIWAYHWLQVGLYEPMVTRATPAARRAGVEAAVARFWQMLESPPAGMPQVMPMTAAVAPEFSRRHPRAAVIFDNLHALHDIISDILTSEKVPADRKKAEIYAALARYQDGSRDTMEMEHWWMMGEMMGGVELMGGKAPGGE